MTQNTSYNKGTGSPGAGHHFTEHVTHKLNSGVLIETQEAYGGYTYINDNYIVARSPLTGLQPVVEQAIDQVIGNLTVEQATAAAGGYKNLESLIANQITQLNDWDQLTETTQSKIMILTGVNFNSMTAAEQEVTINHLQHSPLPFGEIDEVLSESVTIDLGYTHTLDKADTISEHVGNGIYKVTMISNNNNGSHTGHNLGSFKIDMNNYTGVTEGEYAVSGTASSSYDDYYYSASGAVGDNTTDTFWFPQAADGIGEQTLELKYSTAVNASGVDIYESEASGAVTKVELKDADGNYHVVWAGTDYVSTAGELFSVQFDGTDFLTDTVRVTIDTDHAQNGYEGIAAVKLIAVRGADDGSGREAIAIEVGNRMVQNTNDNNQLYLDDAARDVLYSRVERNDFEFEGSEHVGGSGSPGEGHHFTEHVEHQLNSGLLIETQEAYGGYAYTNDNYIVARSPLTGLQPVVEQAIDQVIGNLTVEQAAAASGGYKNLESLIANQITQLNDWEQLTEETQAEIMIMTGVDFNSMTAAEQEVTINHLQHSPLPFGEIDEVLSESVTIDLGYTHTLDKADTISEHVGNGIYKVSMISNNNNGSHTGHNLGSFKIDMNNYTAVTEGEYAVSGTASSSLDRWFFSASQAAGDNTNGMGWIPQAPDGIGEQTLELKYSTAVNASGVDIYESQTSGAVTKVELKDADGNYHVVWAGTDYVSTAGKLFSVQFDGTDFLTDTVRVTIDTNHTLNAYEGIAAVKLIALRGADDGSGREAIAIEVGNRMVQNTNDNNQLYLDDAARDVLYGRVERNDFDFDNAYNIGGTDHPHDGEDGGQGNNPIAEPDDLTVDSSPNQILDVLANDSDADGDTLTILSFTQPANGTITLTADGKLSYTPNSGFEGAEVFEYTVSDGNGGTDSTAVDFWVNDVTDSSGDDVQIDFSEFLSVDDNMDALLGESVETGLVTRTVSSTGTVADTTTDILQQLVDLQDQEYVQGGY